METIEAARAKQQQLLEASAREFQMKEQEVQYYSTSYE